jgi:hypothetical protein
LAFIGALPIITGPITVLDYLAANQALRLYSGFVKGEPRIAADLSDTTLVLHSNADPTAKGDPLVEAAQAFYLQHIHRIRCVIVKSRKGKQQGHRMEMIRQGDTLDRRPFESVRAHFFKALVW